MNRLALMLVCGAMSLVVSACGGRSPSQQAQSTPPTVPPAPTLEESGASPTGRVPSRAVQPALAALPTADRGGRSRPTPSSLPEQAGRNNPFSSVTDAAVLVNVPTMTEALTQPLMPQVAPTAQPMPAVSSLAVPPPPPALTTVPIPAQMPAPTVEGSSSSISLPSRPPQLLANRIQVTGMVQVGDRLAVITETPGDATSRTVSVGDYLGEGQVLVKRIEMDGLEPLIVLEEQGQEIMRTLGSIVP
ncbi:MAG: hypothetical protein KME20_22290 [Kaiparowitsia implicata GSE-PSE-MK54-09C]|nr:hypothetical protein [Kaiparowitsia implicata GSE-PSE-MK54-09C]